MEKAKKALSSALLQIVPLIGNSPLWLVALMGLGLRLFVVRPLGATLALCAGCVWFWHNKKLVGERSKKLMLWFNTWANGYEKESLWYKNEGRVKIVELIDWLSSQGISYCNLADELQLPPKSHWHAISLGLNEIGIATQISDDAFYMSWRLPKKEAEQPATA